MFDLFDSKTPSSLVPMSITVAGFSLLGLASVLSGCGSGVKVAHLGVRQVTHETQVSTMAPSSPLPTTALEAPQTPPAQEEPASPEEPPAPTAPNHTSPLGQIDMIDLVSALIRQTDNRLAYATQASQQEDTDRACSQLAQMVGAAEGAERLRVALFPTSGTLANAGTPPTLAAWDALIQPVGALAAQTFTAYCSRGTEHFESHTYLNAQYTGPAPESLRVQLDTRRAALATPWDRFEIPLLPRTEQANATYLRSLTTAIAYLTCGDILTQARSQAVCHAVSKALGSYDVWFDAGTDTQGGNGFNLLNPPAESLFATFTRDQRRHVVDIKNSLVRARDASCGGVSSSESRGLAGIAFAALNDLALSLQPTW